MDAAGLPALIEAIRHLHGLEAKWLESVPVTEIFAGKTIWDGQVQVFEVKHPKANCVYAGSHATEGTKRRLTLLGCSAPVDSAQVRRHDPFRAAPTKRANKSGLRRFSVSMGA